ncbi:MAG: four-helix bundle copper-binding protein [Bacteroidota bacterium]|nr:four-helix bundle copper-binding protein [Bacteroidota bacterium]
MENKIIESCIAACQTCVDTCETCSTENNGKAGMENSVKLCIACKDACNELINASKNNANNLDALCKKCEDACIACATECAKHTDMHHCKVCADACNKCAAECKAMLAVEA